MSMFKSDHNLLKPQNKVRYVCDAIFTQYFIIPLGIFAWRNLWCFYDAYWFPNNSLLGYVCGFIIGGMSCILLPLTETSLTFFVKECTQYNFYFRLIVLDCVVFITFIAMLLYWRAFWNFNWAYMIPDPFLGGWVNYAASSVLMFALQIHSCVAHVGCAIDCDKKTIVTPIFPMNYVREYAHFCSATTEQVG